MPMRHQPLDLPREYETIDEEAHDRQIVHAGERVSSTVAQRWLGTLTRDERDTTDIERHARQVDGSQYPELLEVVRSVARMLGVDREPRLFLSFGSSGVDVLGTEAPLILLGACHLDPDDDRHLGLRHLTFARCALYTADRVGVLACDDLATAVDAIVRMSPSHSDYATRLDEEGLLPLLSERGDEGKPRNEELALRIGELFKFVLSDDYRRLRNAVVV